METKCPKCRTKDFENCHSIRCPMRNETIKSDNTKTLENALEQIQKLEADKAELLSILKGLVSDVGNLIGEYDIEWQQAGYFEYAKELIQKHKQ